MLNAVQVTPVNKAAADLFPSSVLTNKDRIDIKCPCLSNTSCTPYELKFKPGSYLFEIWGSYFSKFSSPGGAGYVKGSLTFTKDTVLYAYVGKVGTNFNFGTQSYNFIAGAATDIRTESGDWNSITGKRSRIMVAGGGGDSGGLNNWNSGNPYGGPSGGINGFPGGNINTGNGGAGATQTSGGGFGISSVGCSGGNGYYSGFSGYYSNGVAGGGGGSSYVSGFSGCNSVDKDGKHTGSPNHYSKYVFSSPQIKNGMDSFASPNNIVRKGYVGNSVLRITLINLHKQTSKILKMKHFPILISGLFISLDY